MASLGWVAFSEFYDEKEERTKIEKITGVKYKADDYVMLPDSKCHADHDRVNPFNASCSKLLMFEGCSAILV